MVYNTIIFSDEAANVASKVMNEYDVHVTLILCVAAIIIVAIVCHAIKVVNSNKKQETIKAILEDMLKNDSKIIDTIKKFQDSEKSKLEQETIKAILEDMLKNDSKIIDAIKKIQGGDKSNLNQDTDAGK